MWVWQKDGAPPHGLSVHAFLNYDAEWIVRRGNINWPARSPDLTLCDISMLGLFQENIMLKKPQSWEHIKELLMGHFDVLFTPHLCKKFGKSV